MIELTQQVTVIYEVRYTREQAIELLVSAGAERESTEKAGDEEIATMLAAAANKDGDSSGKPDEPYTGIYERLTDDAGDWSDTAGVGDWTARVVP